MFYFVTNKLDKNLSSVEEVELNRLKIFKKICLPAKILTLIPDLHFDERQKQYHVEQDSISLFDWLLLKDQIDTRPIVNYLDIFNNLGAKGFNLGLFEASSRGLINISYDIKYGPRENILNGETGSLLPLDSHNDRNSRSKLLAGCLRNWLKKSDKEIAESMHLAQKLTYEKYNLAQVCQDWRDIAKIIENHKQ